MARRNNSLLSPIQTVEPQTQQITFDQAVRSFILHNRAKNLSPNSLEFYEYNLHYMQKVFQEQNIPLDYRNITGKQIKQHFTSYMLDKGLASNTINGRLKSCKAFFTYLYEEKMTAHNVSEQFDLVIAEKKMIQTLTKEQVILLLNQPDRNTFSGLRDYTLMMVLLETGMRIGECIALEIDDVNLKECEIRIKMGKGRKARRVPIQKTCVQVLKSYLAERGELETKALFVNIDNKPLHRRTIQENIQEYGKAAQITSARVSPHTFRHTMAKFYIINGGDIFTLQQILGHSSLEMVRYYVELFSTDIHQQHQKYSPVENMGLTRKSKRG
ncbi:tyrosine-type recombinase/integrase [Ferviditalea candida]|uniref:Tyrosine-type recombinase/integrase n=1 Tax=Ferviditalea candida TaxID=3108399 RepID=A0ABU5ZMI6_9BACL|nr:tyrosine-type recombinase/integrase [Paenibacillaceae bacterium T2]